jgi:hypothetical protein
MPEIPDAEPGDLLVDDPIEGLRLVRRVHIPRGVLSRTGSLRLIWVESEDEPKAPPMFATVARPVPGWN